MAEISKEHNLDIQNSLVSPFESIFELLPVLSSKSASSQYIHPNMQYKTSPFMASLASVLVMAPMVTAVPAPMEQINANWEIATSWQKRDLQKRNLVGVLTDSVPRDAGIPGASIMSSNIDEPDLGLFQTMLKWIGSEKVGVMKGNSEKQVWSSHRFALTKLDALFLPQANTRSGQDSDLRW